MEDTPSGKRVGLQVSGEMGRYLKEIDRQGSVAALTGLPEKTPVKQDDKDKRGESGQTKNQIRQPR